MEFAFQVPWLATKKTSQRIVRAGSRLKVIPSRKTLTAQAELGEVALIAARRAGLMAPVTVFVDVDITAGIRIPKTGPNKGARPGLPAAAPRFDRTGLVALVDDALEGIVYVNDGQVTGGVVARIWSHEEYLHVRVIIPGKGKHR